MGGARRSTLAVPGIEPEEADRAEHEGQGVVRAEEAGGEVALRDIDQHAGAQRPAPEIAAIGAQRLLVEGAAVDVVEHDARQPAPVRPGAHPRHSQAS